MSPPLSWSVKNLFLQTRLLCEKSPFCNKIIIFMLNLVPYKSKKHILPPPPHPHFPHIIYFLCLPLKIVEIFDADSITSALRLASKIFLFICLIICTETDIFLFFGFFGKDKWEYNMKLRKIRRLISESK